MRKTRIKIKFFQNEKESSTNSQDAIEDIVCQVLGFFGIIEAGRCGGMVDAQRSERCGL